MTDSKICNFSRVEGLECLVKIASMSCQPKEELGFQDRIYYLRARNIRPVDNSGVTFPTRISGLTILRALDFAPLQSTLYRCYFYTFIFHSRTVD